MNTVNVRAISAVNAKRSVWYPFTVPEEPNRLNITAAEGILLRDSTGREYYDAVSCLWNMPLGYSVGSIREAVIRQQEQMPFCSLMQNTAPCAEEAAVLLLHRIGAPMEKVIWGCTGSESIECAIKLMRAYQKCAGKCSRTRILSMDGSYHGTHYGAVSISGLEQDAQAEIAPVLPDTALLKPALADEPDAVIQRKTEQSLEYIKGQQEHIAGIVIEPVLASAGVQTIHVPYLKAVCSLCREYDIPVAFDEITTGFYRTGSLFYFQQIGITPDLLCLSKAINNGWLPLSAVAVSSGICGRFQQAGFVLQHGTTQGGNLCALAAMIAADAAFSELISREDPAEKAAAFGNVLREKVMRTNYAEQVRQNGFMYSVKLREEQCACGKDVPALMDAIRRRGVIVYPAETGLTLMPAFCTTAAQWDTVTDRIGEAMDSYTAEGF